MENTNPKTIGVCPLGQRFNGEVPEEISGTDLEKCTPCTKCNPGYYLKEALLAEGSSLRAVSTGEKLVLGTNNKLKVKASADDAVDVIVSYVETT